MVPHDANSDDDDEEYQSEEKAFDRLTAGGNGNAGGNTHRIIYTPSHCNANNIPMQMSAAVAQTLSLTTAAAATPTATQLQPLSALSPTGQPLNSASAFASLTSPTAAASGLKPYGELSLTTNPAYALYNSPARRQPPPPLYSSPKAGSNIYTRVPTRPFVPYDSRLSPTSTYGVAGDMTQQQQQQQRGLSPTYETRISPIYGTSAGSAQPLLQHQHYHLQQLQGSACTLTAGSSSSTSGDDQHQHHQHHLYQQLQQPYAHS